MGASRMLRPQSLAYAVRHAPASSSRSTHDRLSAHGSERRDARAELHARARRRRELHRAGPAGQDDRARLLSRSPSAPSAPTSCSSTSRCSRELREQGGDALRRLLRLDAGRRAAFKEKLGVSSEQLSDFEPKGAACAAFGVLHPGGFPAARARDHRPRRRRALELSRPPRRASCRAELLARASRPRLATRVGLSSRGPTAAGLSAAAVR